MCGIAGIYHKEKPVESAELRKMTMAIAHRGPDGEGHWINPAGNTALGHRRLSIIDLSQHAAQPMHYGDGRYSITFNGEIYNYIELKEELVKAGVSFQTQSDTEVLLALYARKKEKCLDELDGMYAFAIWDEQEKTLFCARDRFGEKPFYYHIEPGQKFVFGSEMKVLWAGGVMRRRNERMLLNFLARQHKLSDFRHPEETFYQDIQKLEPGHYLMVDKELIVKKKRYWDIDLSKRDNKITEADAIEKFRALLFTSVSRRLRSDVPVGSSLSGGLDSSAIVCAIHDLDKQKKHSQKTFSARFRDYVKDEGIFMQKVIEKTGVEGHFVWPDAGGFLEEFKRLCYHQEEPFAGGSVYAQWKVMELAKQEGITVLLDGQGADEFLAGYPFFFPTYLHDLFKAGSPGYQGELREYKHRYNPAFGGFEESKGLKKELKARIRPLYKSLFRKNEEYSAIRKGGVFTPEYLAQFMEGDVFENRFEGGLPEQLYQHTCVDGLQDLLRFADRNSMAHSREVRLPFLNHSLVEFVFTLPSGLKIKDGWSKYILRKSFEHLLPQEITWRKDKIGFAAPHEQWMESPPFRELVKESVDKLEREKILSPAKNGNTSSELGWNALIAFNTLFI